jgi:ADP-heptose:LPS heptosyltransferase
VLVIFAGALGDLVVFAPTLRALARRHAGSSLELMARDELARFAVGRIGVSRAHSIDRRELSALFTREHDAHREAARFWGSFDHIYSFFAADDSHFRDALTAANGGGCLSFHPFHPAGDGHIANAYLDSIGESPGGASEPCLTALAEDLAAASRILDRFRLIAGEFVLIHPGSGSAAKNWPARNFAALADALGESARGVLIVVGPAEEHLHADLAVGGRALVSSPPLATLAGLARLAGVYVGNDSGVSHLAAAAGAPSVVLFGPTDPARWCPQGRVQVIRRESIESIPCDEVLARVNRSIQEGSGTE